MSARGSVQTEPQAGGRGDAHAGAHADARALAMAPVVRVERALLRMAWARAACLAVIAGAIGWLLTFLLSTLAGVNAPLVWSTVAFALTAAVVARASVRQSGRMSTVRAALWLEEQFPSLQYALVTLAEYDDALPLAPAAYERLLAYLQPVNVSVPLRQRSRAQLRMPALGALVAVMIAIPLTTWIKRIAPLANRSVAGDAAARSAAAGVNRKALAQWRVRVIPPAYSGRPATNLGDAGSAVALVGSRVEVQGDDRTAPTFVLHALADSAVQPAASRAALVAEHWHADLAMPAVPTEVIFSIDAITRQLLLEPRADSLPVVRLTRPERDTVLRQARGAMQLAADAHDDLGLASSAFELIVSSGEGERFTARTIVISNAVNASATSTATSTAWRATLLLDTMHLEPGDIVHLRAVARDRHPDLSRGAGTSETRTLRIARPAEYDSVAVDPAPPPEVDKSLLSQRMLLMLTEKLEQRRPKLSRTVLVEESRSLAGDQARLRKLVGNLVFQRLEGEGSAEHEHSPGDGHDHGMDLVNGKLVPSTTGTGSQVLDFDGDESPVVSINRPLLEAYNAMWDAASALDIADPKGAIPHMRIALAAIQRARSAERIYLRGKPPTLVVDIAKVRLAGRDTGQSNGRAAREALSPREAMREARLLVAASLLSRDASAARDSLALLRLESLSDAPRFAAALGEALDVARRGGDLTATLLRARRLLGGQSTADSLSAWRGFP